MVHPVEAPEQSSADLVDAHLGAHALAMSRHSYTIKEKHKLLQAICTLLSKGVSICQACPLFGLPHQYYYHCRKAVKAADDLKNTNDIFVHYKVNGSARKIHPSWPSILSAVHDNLTQFIAAMRTRGIQVSSHMVCHEASCLLPNFMTKTISAREKEGNRFTKQMGLTHRAATHTAQKDHHETKEES